MTFPCNVSFRDTMAICQTSQPTPEHDSTPITRAHLECPNGWVKIMSYCHQMISRPGQHLTCKEARTVCKGMFSFSGSGVEMAPKILMYYFEWLDDPQQKLFYGGSINHCIILQVVQSMTLVSVVRQYDSIKSIPHATICKAELIPALYLCSHFQFTCGDGSCILQHYFCDGWMDESGL